MYQFKRTIKIARILLGRSAFNTDVTGDIEHYFENGVELGMYWTGQEEIKGHAPSCTVFLEPRKWSNEILNNYKVTKYFHIYKNEVLT